jgi:hypothetical protein
MRRVISAPKPRTQTYFVGTQQITQGIQPRRDEHRPMMIRSVVYNLVRRA